MLEFHNDNTMSISLSNVMILKIEFFEVNKTVTFVLYYHKYRKEF